MRSIAIDLDGALGDTRPLWRDWLDHLGRTARVDVGSLPEDRCAAAQELDRLVSNWRPLLERYAEDRAPVYLRPSADASAALRRLRGAGVRLGAFTDAPEPLARVALAQLGATRRLDAIEAGPGALERLRAHLGSDVVLVRTRDQLLRLVS